MGKSTDMSTEEKTQQFEIAMNDADLVALGLLLNKVEQISTRHDLKMSEQVMSICLNTVKAQIKTTIYWMTRCRAVENQLAALLMVKKH